MSEPSNETRRSRRAPRTEARTALAPEEASRGMLVRRLCARAEDVVLVKGILDGSEGLAALFAEHGGELTIAAPLARAAELDELLADLATELAVRIEEPGDA